MIESYPTWHALGLEWSNFIDAHRVIGPALTMAAVVASIGAFLAFFRKEILSEKRGR